MIDYGNKSDTTTSFDYSLAEENRDLYPGDHISYHFEPGHTAYFLLVEKQENDRWKTARTSSNSMDWFAEKHNLSEWSPIHTGTDKIHKCNATGLDVQVGQKWTTKVRGRSRKVVIRSVVGELVVAEFCRKSRTQDFIYLSKTNLRSLSTQVQN